jgi:two-component system, OmpR family, response regulator RegX3
MRIALLEDDMLQSELLMNWLADDGHECMSFATGTEFRLALKRRVYGLAMLDWLLPDDDGLNVLTWLRESVSAQMPIMMITVRAEESALVQALNAGADDYLTKPVRREELLARVRVLSRRHEVLAPASDAVLVYGPIAVDFAQRTVELNGVTVALSKKEFELAAALLQNPGRLLSRRALIEQIWGSQTNPDSRSIDTYVSRLRAKLQLMPEHGFDLANIYGQGYRLELLKQF